jgi:alpha-tubulin suppressor-like RCC1 family protein
VVFCWGTIWEYRKDGLEYSSDRLVPLRVDSAPSMAGLSVGTFTTCGFDATGFVYCWEANPRGGMGNGTTEGSKVPRRVASPIEVKQISVGLLQTCAVATDGIGWCWGDNTFGQLAMPYFSAPNRCGSAFFPCSTAPVRVSGRQLFANIATGFGSHACGVSTRGNLYCWGLGVSGQRGDGRLGTREVFPIRIRSQNAQP